MNGARIPGVLTGGVGAATWDWPAQGAPLYETMNTPMLLPVLWPAGVSLSQDWKDFIMGVNVPGKNYHDGYLRHADVNGQLEPWGGLDTSGLVTPGFAWMPYEDGQQATQAWNRVFVNEASIQAGGGSLAGDFSLYDVAWQNSRQLGAYAVGGATSTNISVSQKWKPELPSIASLYLMETLDPRFTEGNFTDDIIQVVTNVGGTAPVTDHWFWLMKDGSSRMYFHPETWASGYHDLTPTAETDNKFQRRPLPGAFNFNYRGYWRLCFARPLSWRKEKGWTTVQSPMLKTVATTTAFDITMEPAPAEWASQPFNMPGNQLVMLYGHTHPFSRALNTLLTGETDFSFTMHAYDGLQGTTTHGPVAFATNYENFSTTFSPGTVTTVKLENGIDPLGERYEPAFALAPLSGVLESTVLGTECWRSGINRLCRITADTDSLKATYYPNEGTFGVSFEHSLLTIPDPVDGIQACYFEVIGGAAQGWQDEFEMPKGI